MERSSGIILHITSLPSPYGVGDLGPSAYRFVDFLESSGIRYWQILPLNYTEERSGFSPYSGLSAFAGNTLLISPDLLLEEKLLDKKDLEHKGFDEEQVEYPKVVNFKKKLFDKAFINYRETASANLLKGFDKFCKENSQWLDDYAAYKAFKDYLDGRIWSQWPEEIKYRKSEAIDNLKTILSESIEKEKFLQFIFSGQWEKLRQYCKEKNIKFIGDMPFYVGYDSADVWAYPQYFKLDDKRNPLLVAGVPPDYFSETGQLWGMPVFEWDRLKRDGFSWWLKRIDHNLKMFDLLRLDHFRAFSAYWEVLSSEDTAINGSWTPGPGRDFFNILRRRYPEMPLIAEDLGEIDQPVRDLIAKYNLPGMRVLQFAFGDDMSKSIHIPHNHIQNSIVYTGTHDNNTIVGWFENDLSKADKQRISLYLNKKVKKQTIHHDMISLALMSVSQLAVFPIQDIFGLGQEAIMNRPSTASGNWGWRVKEDLFTEKAAKKLKTLILLYNREGSSDPKSGVNNEKKKSSKALEKMEIRQITMVR